MQERESAYEREKARTRERESAREREERGGKRILRLYQSAGTLISEKSGGGMCCRAVMPITKPITSHSCKHSVIRTRCHHRAVMQAMKPKALEVSFARHSNIRAVFGGSINRTRFRRGALMQVMSPLENEATVNHLQCRG